MSKPSLRQGLILGLTASVGIALSAIATLFAYRWEVSQQQGRFQQDIENLTIALQRSLNRYTAVLTFLDDYYRVNEGQVERAAFDNFVARSLADYPGIQALEWAPLVALEDRGPYEQTVRDEGYPSFEITELDADQDLVRAGERPYYIPVTYVAPLTDNEAAMGFDLNSSPVRAAAIDPAITSGHIHATGRVRLVQEQRDQYGFLVVSPLYEETVGSSFDRENRFEGLLVGVFRVSDVVEEASQDLNPDIDFVLKDQSAVPEEQFLGQFDAASQKLIAIEPETSRPLPQTPILCPTASDCTSTLEIGQRQWQVEFTPGAAYPLQVSYATGTTLFVGLLLTGGLVLGLRNLQNELIRTQALNDSKLRFFSMASHELRTPLSTILLSAESLQTYDEQLSSAQKQNALQRIHQTAMQMGQQITDLLTWTRAEVGKLEFSPELIDAPAYCEQVIADVQSGVSQSIQFTQPQHSVKAFWDKKLVRSLLSNLLSNAAKYSPSDDPIHVTFEHTTRQATLRVSDCGMGIPEADQALVVAAFQRGSNVDDVAGTGLGLAIVNVCVELHDGQWTLDSKEGQGTTVTVTLPLE